jgi:fumarate hydratase class II
MTAHRIERDSFGPIEVPAAHLWGAQTQRSLAHFRICGATAALGRVVCAQR